MSLTWFAGWDFARNHSLCNTKQNTYSKMQNRWVAFRVFVMHFSDSHLLFSKSFWKCRFLSYVADSYLFCPIQKWSSIQQFWKIPNTLVAFAFTYQGRARCTLFFRHGIRRTWVLPISVSGCHIAVLAFDSLGHIWNCILSIQTKRTNHRSLQKKLLVAINLYLDSTLGASLNGCYFHWFRQIWVIGPFFAFSWFGFESAFWVEKSLFQGQFSAQMAVMSVSFWSNNHVKINFQRHFKKMKHSSFVKYLSKIPEETAMFYVPVKCAVLQGIVEAFWSP